MVLIGVGSQVESSERGFSLSSARKGFPAYKYKRGFDRWVSPPNKQKKNNFLLLVVYDFLLLFHCTFVTILEQNIGALLFLL